jgi:type I restriction enzyme R subunit
MTGSSPTENLVEESAVALWKTLGIRTRPGTLIDGTSERAGLESFLIDTRLVKVLKRLNPNIDIEICKQVLAQLRRPPHTTLIENNRWFHQQLTEGIEVEFKDQITKETRGGRARIIDFDNPLQNDFLVARQFTIQNAAGKTIRLDLALFVNGLPLVIIELKDPADVQADLNRAIDQFQRYKEIVPDLFFPNVLLAVSDGLLTRVGSITSSRERFSPWRPAAGGEPTLETLIRELLTPEAFLDYLRSCVTFEQDERGIIAKKIAGYHQFRAVRKSRSSILAALTTTNTTEDAGKGGVVWHTQGSGKSLTMLMLGGALVRDPTMANPTIVVVTDRNDLDDQLFGTFAGGRTLLRQDPIQAASRDHLRQLLDRASGGVVFTTIHKFTEAHGQISDRANIVVIADEAHRSQYGFVEGGAKWMRDSLPNATFIGFTGTPIDKADRSTPRIFGNYADVYDIRQAVQDGATVPIYYEPRIVKLTVDAKGAEDAEKKLAALAVADENGLEPEQDVRIPLEALVGAQERVDRLANFIVDHWEKRRSAMEGKAMAVTMSRDIAARLFAAIRKLRPDWHHDDDDKGFMKVIMTSGPDDPPELAVHSRTKAQRKALAARFKDPADDFRLAIVVDMWLTGFDVPCAHTMYLDKPLAGHNLMQAIARVNRVYGDKPGGLVVDLLGLADQLADALATYAKATGETESDPIRKVQDEAVPAMQSAFEKLRNFFHAVDYTAALAESPQNVLRVYLSAVDHVFAQDDGWKRFRQMVKELSTAYALAVPRPAADNIAPHLAFFQRVVAMIRKRLADDRSPADRQPAGSDIDLAVRQVIGSAVDAGDVIDLFAAAGLEGGRLDILSDDFLSRVAALEQKNLALETLRKLLADQIRSTERINLVQSLKFREALEKAMLRYTNKQITTAEMIAQLLELAKWVREVQKRGQDLGLTGEETAFYDALAENGSAKDVMTSDTLRLMARELTEMVRADLRRNVRRLLAKFGYPPDLSEDATQLVLRQAELSTENLPE